VAKTSFIAIYSVDDQRRLALRCIVEAPSTDETSGPKKKSARVTFSRIAAPLGSTWFAAGTNNSTVYLIDRTCKEQEVISLAPKRKLQVYGLSVSDNGKYLALALDNREV